MNIVKFTGTIVALGLLIPLATLFSNGTAGTSGNSVIISLDDVTYQPQAMVAVPLEIENEDLNPFSSLGMEISYDKTKLQYTGVKPGTVIDDFEEEFVIDETDTGIKILYMDLSETSEAAIDYSSDMRMAAISEAFWEPSEGDILSSGILCSLMFKTRMAPNETATISLEGYCMGPYEEAQKNIKYFHFVSGSVTTTGDELIGDATNDGSIDSADYYHMRSYLMEYATPAAFDEGFYARMDVNDDGCVDNADYTMLRKYLLGKITSFPAGVYVTKD
jgi:hypothetical protein